MVAELVKQHGLRSGAEIGVADGRFTAALLDLCPELKLWAIDYWPSGYKTWMGTEWTEDTQRNNRAAFMAMRCDGRHERIIVMEMPSVEAAAVMNNGVFDFVFIDAGHDYDEVKADIAAWLPKVRYGGWITGHDYDMAKFPGVVRAVEESFADFTLGDDHVWMAQVTR